MSRDNGNSKEGRDAKKGAPRGRRMKKKICSFASIKLST